MKTAFGRRMRRLMAERGLSLRQLARNVPCNPGYLSRVMNGERSPSAQMVERLDHLLSAEGTLIAAAAPLGPDTSKLDELELLRRGLTDVLCEGSMAEAGLDEWDQTVSCHGRATRDQPAGVLYTDLVTDLIELKRALARCHTASALRHLTHVTAQMAGLMYLVLVKLDKQVESRRWARTARTAARETGDPVVECWVLAQEAHGHYYGGDLEQAIEVARHAQHLTRNLVCAGAPLATALEARARAALGDRDGARTLLARVGDLVSQLDADSLVPSAFGYNEAQLRFHEGNAYTLLAHADDDGRSAIGEALTAQEKALELCAAGDYTDWALTRLDRAACLALGGDPSAGMSYMVETLSELTEQQCEGLITLRGREIVNALPRAQQALPIVRDVRALLMRIARDDRGVDP